MAYLVRGGTQQFKEATKKTVAGKGKLKIRVSGKNLVPILAALEHYETTIQGPLSKKQGALCSVISKCKKWLTLKQAKIATADMDSNVKQRQTQVNDLMNEAWQALQASDQGATAHAFQAYQARKEAGAHQMTRGLSPGYTNERDAYVQSGKTKSLSGSLIDDLLGTGKTRIFPLPPPAKLKGATGEWEDNPARPAFARQNQIRKATVQKAVKGRDLGQLSVADWQKIDKIASTVPGGLETKYMKRPERLNCMLESNGAGGLRYAVGPRSAATAAGMEWPYAMDEWGNIYTANDQAPASRDGKGMFNHSSFTAGDDVVCAGMLKIDAAGKLTFIDTNSGHYKPTAEQLRAVIVILRDEYNVDLSGTRASTAEPRVVWGVGEIDRFLAGQPPVPRPNKPLPPIPH